MKARTIGYLSTVFMGAILAVVLVGSRRVAVEAVYPVENAKLSFISQIGSCLVGLFRGSAALAENRNLRREIESLKVLRGDIDRLETENARLRRALDYVARKPETWLAAAVLSRDGGAAGIDKSLRVNKGSLAGVREGAIVVVSEGLVGKVIEVSPHTAKVLLVTDPSLKVSCDVMTGSSVVGSSGILVGAGGDLLVIRHLRNDAKLMPRSAVLTSGRGGVFPRGLEVGTLLDVRKDSNGRVTEGEVLPAVDYATLEDVFIRCEK